MIEVTPAVKIDENEIQYDYVRSSGPGGQNVNKVATSVQLRFDIRNSPSLEAEVKERLIKLAGSRVTEDGVLIIEAKRYRTQDQNRYDATRRLILLIQQALEKPKKRHPTHPSSAAREKRLQEKRRRGWVKAMRSRPSDEE